MDQKNEQQAFARGFDAGAAANLRNETLTPYLRVGIDDYARGYRAGFYARKAVASSLLPGRNAPMQKSA